MSKFSGKCDLYDHISMEKMEPSPSNPNILISDDNECFEIFKKKTDGKIYQHIEIELTEFNIENEIENNKYLSRDEIRVVKNDKRYKSGIKEVVQYVYHYFGKTFHSLRELNNYGYIGVKTIEFDTIFDLIPYFPYTIASAACSKDSEKIFISSMSHPDAEYLSHRKYGNNPRLSTYYKKELQKYYFEKVKEVTKNEKH